MSISMDLTGSLDSFKETDKVFKIFKYGQRVDFDTVVFKESLAVYLISGGVTTQLVLGTDFTIPDEFVSSCDNDTSRAKLMDPDFDKELISGIQMSMVLDEKETYRINVSYQRLYPNHTRTAYLHNEPLNLTPELTLDIIQKLEQLTALTHEVTDVSSLESADSICLELDIDETNDNNKIEGEEHTLNVGNGRYVIAPKCGSFYKDSVKVYHPDSKTYLVSGTDYFIAGMNEAKTKVTASTNPVYDFIIVTAQLAGKVQISYHAFGGDPTIDNYKDLLKQSNNIIQYLSQAKNITEDTLGSTDLMTSIFDRIDSLETNMRRLQGTPAYGDITSGKSILMKLFAEKPGLHWYTIASLYKITGDDTAPSEADTFIFRLQSQLSHFQFKAEVSVDLNNQEGDRFNVNVTSENYPRGYTPFTDYGSIDAIIRPQLRVVWNSSDTMTGAYLQLGFTLTNMLEETVAIEDLSGHESCWKLVDEVSTVTQPSDSDFTLPNGTSIWSTSLDTSLKESMLVPFKKGHLAWCGSVTMNRPDAGWQYCDLGDELLLEDSVDITRITKLRVDIEEVDGFQFPIDINFNAKNTTLKGHASFTHGNLPAYINAEVYRKTDGSINIRLNYEITAGTTSNELRIRDVVVY